MCSSGLTSFPQVQPAWSMSQIGTNYCQCRPGAGVQPRQQQNRAAVSQHWCHHQPRGTAGRDREALCTDLLTISEEAVCCVW